MAQVSFPDWTPTSKVTAGLGFYVIHEFLFFPLYQPLSTMTLYSSDKLDSTISQNTSQVFPTFYLCTCFCPLLYRPCLLSSSSRGSAGTNHPFHSLSVPCICQLPAQFPSSTNTTNAVTKVNLACLLFTALWPYYFWIFKARNRLIFYLILILNSMNNYWIPTSCQTMDIYQSITCTGWKKETYTHRA